VERKKAAPIAKPAQPQAPPPPQPQEHEAEHYEPPAEEAPQKVWSRPRHADSDQKAPTTKKNKYMKVVFYSEPPKSKVENLLKSLDDSEDVPPPAKRTAQPAKRAPAAPAKAKPKPTRRQQSAGDDLEELARLYFS
jgi:hypothetical protein